MEQAVPSPRQPADATGQSGPGTRWLREHVRPRARPLGIAFALFLALNLLLLAGYLWSRGGQTTHVRLEARGNQFMAFIDGSLHGQAQFNAAPEGGIALALQDTEKVPSLPAPRGIDEVRVTDLATGDVLFEDDFSSGFGGLGRPVGTLRHRRRNSWAAWRGCQPRPPRPLLARLRR